MEPDPSVSNTGYSPLGRQLGDAMNPLTEVAMSAWGVITCLILAVRLFELISLRSTFIALGLLMGAAAVITKTSGSAYLDGMTVPLVLLSVGMTIYGLRYEAE